MTEDHYSIVFGEASEEIEALSSSSVDLVLTDPPFNHETEHYDSRHPEYAKAFRSLADFAIMNVFFSTLAKEIRRVLRSNGRLLMFCDAYSYPLLYFVFRSKFDHVRALIWYKGKNYFPVGTAQAFRFSYEMIVHGWNQSSFFEKKNRQDVIEHKVEPSDTRLHPAQKPIGLLKQLIEATTKPDDLVLDLFAGSGSILEACLLTGRRNISIEANENMIPIIKQRAVQALQPITVFAESRLLGESPK
jgi:site-specific DNA-methyltransferase (adenine-specific)